MQKFRVSRRDFLVTSAAVGASMGMKTGWSQSNSNVSGIYGQRAPELQIDYWIDAAGDSTQFDLASNQGKWVFLKCFQSWCPGCHSHGFPALKKISDALAENPQIVIVGIQTTFEGFTTNTVDKVREIQLRYDLKIPMGHDPGDPNGDHRPSTMRNYRTGGTPWMILIDPEHRVVFNDFGVDSEKLIEVLKQQTA